MKTLFVRLKNYDPRRGHVLQRYTYKGIKFQAGKGWYRASEEVGEYLRNVLQRADDPHSLLAFDVCTEAEARARDKKEAEDKQPDRPADNARVAVARDEQPPAQSKKRSKSSRATEARTKPADDDKSGKKETQPKV